MVICLERDADLLMAQLMALPLTVSCFSKIQIGFTFLVPAHPGGPGKGLLNVCAVDCWSIWTSALKHVPYVSASCRNTRCKTFTPLFYSTVYQLLINFVPFIFMIFLRKCHNYVTLLRTFNWFCQNQTTISWHIHSRIFVESLVKFAQKLWEMYEKQMYHFFPNMVYNPLITYCFIANKGIVTGQQQPLLPFQGHYTGQPVSAGTSS